MEKKIKFWQGAGVEELLYHYAEEKISDKDFSQERILLNGWVLRSKEELMYYRLFRDTLENYKIYLGWEEQKWLVSYKSGIKFE